MKIVWSFKLKIALGVMTFTGLVLMGFSAFFLASTQRIGLERLDRELVAMGTPQVNRLHPREHWAQLDTSLRSFREDDHKGVYEFMVCDQNRSPVYTSRHWPINLTEQISRLPASPEHSFDNTPEPPAREPPPDLQRPPRGSRSHPPPPGLQEPDGGRPPGRRHSEPQYMTLTSPDKTWRLMTLLNSDITFVMALDLAEFQSEIHSVQTLFTFAIPVALFLLAIGGWLLAGQALRPVRTLTRVAGKITARDLHQRVPVDGAAPEFEELIQILNGMLDRLEKSFQQATRFSADAAHELNTPLTILQGQMEQAIQNAASEPDQQMYAGLLEEVQRLKTIVRKLLLLAKADTGQLTLKRGRVDLSNAIEDLLHDADVLAPGLNIDRQLTAGIMVKADPDLLRQVLQNLLSNAIKYNRPGGLIKLTLGQQADRILFTIGNTTPPSLTLDEKRLFTRFYRGDGSRGRQIDGVGLGLNLSREIVQAHQGTLVLKESSEGWVSFAMTLPASSGDQADDE